MAIPTGKGLYDTLHGEPGSNGATVFGGAPMVLCDDCAELAWDLLSTYWDSENGRPVLLKRSQPIKLELLNPIHADAGFSCESCGFSVEIDGVKHYRR